MCWKCSTHTFYSYVLPVRIVRPPRLWTQELSKKKAALSYIFRYPYPQPQLADSIVVNQTFSSTFENSVWVWCFTHTLCIVLALKIILWSFMWNSIGSISTISGRHLRVFVPQGCACALRMQSVAKFILKWFLLVYFVSSYYTSILQALRL